MPDRPDLPAPHRTTKPQGVRWHRVVPWVALVVGAGMISLVWLRDPEPVGSVVLTVVVALAVAAAFWSARRGRHAPYGQAKELIATDHAVVLWKPGCSYCERLLVQLRDTSGISWVNVYEDPEADAKVRSVNGGDQLTPTALVGDRVLRNPSAAELRAVLETH